MTDFSKTLIRCSALGYIMTEQRGKNNLEKYNDAVDELSTEQAKYDAMPKKDGKAAKNKLNKIKLLEVQLQELDKVKDEIILSDTCKTYLIQSYVLSKYGRVREIQTKQMIKGTLSEEESIDLFSVLEKTPYNKNTMRLSNEYITGCPDLFDTDDIIGCNEIIDIKSCWDIFTFLSNIEEPENSLYYWQLQGYMALTRAKIGTVAYCLVNTPDSLIEGEKWNLLRKMDVATEEDPAFKRELELLLANRKYDDIPMADRLLTYSIDRNDVDIERMYKKIEKCRQFLSEFEEKHALFSKNYRKQAKKQHE
jgi:hypothetical protein